MFQIQDRLRTRPELFFEKRIPQPSPEFDLEKPILPQIKEKDKLLSYPFESMKPFLRMLHEAANDKSVIAIKMTLYRLSRQSKVVEALIEAAENGKEVFVMIELKLALTKKIILNGQEGWKQQMPIRLPMTWKIEKYERQKIDIN